MGSPALGSSQPPFCCQPGGGLAPGQGLGCYQLNTIHVCNYAVYHSSTF